MWLKLVALREALPVAVVMLVMDWPTPPVALRELWCRRRRTTWGTGGSDGTGGRRVKGKACPCNG